MLQEVRTYRTDDGHPNDSEIQQCLDIIGDNDFVIELKWIMKWSGEYNVIITKDDTVESVKKRLPKIYGL